MELHPHREHRARPKEVQGLLPLVVAQGQLEDAAFDIIGRVVDDALLGEDVPLRELPRRYAVAGEQGLKVV